MLPVRTMQAQACQDRYDDVGNINCQVEDSRVIRPFAYENLHDVTFVNVIPEEVQLFYADLEHVEGSVDDFVQLLSSDEIMKANSFIFTKLRKRYIRGRGLLRIILGSCLGILPDRVSFSYNSYGKPFIHESLNKIDLRFNLSHSNGVIAIALSIGCEIGIDIEQIKPIAGMHDIAKTIYTPCEKKILESSTALQRIELFFRFWTRKEATAKAIGTGLAQPIEKIDVSTCSSNPVAAIVRRRKCISLSKWFVRDIQPFENYAASVAVEGYPRRDQQFYISAY